MKRALVLFAALTAACTYGPVEDHVNVQNLALKPDGPLLAVIVKYERYRRATGLSSFPDGGVPRTLVQRADLYIVDLRSRTQLYRGELSAPPDHRISFSPWLMGWEGDRVYFKITGCPGSPGSECYGPLVRTSVFTLSASGRIAPVRSSVSPVLTTSRDDITRYVTAGVEPYGVSISTRPGSPRTPLLRFVDLRLEVISAQGVAQPNQDSPKDSSFSVQLRLDDAGTSMPSYFIKEESTSSLRRTRSRSPLDSISLARWSLESAGRES